MGLATIGWSAVAAVAALIAAGCALAGLVFARLTVSQGGRMLKSMQRAHREEMAERKKAREADLTVRRIAQAQRVLEILIELRDKATAAVPPVAPSLGESVPTQVDALAFQAAKAAAEKSRAEVPPTGAKLGAALAALSALGGSDLEALVKLADGAERRTLPAPQIVMGAHEAIVRIHELFEEEPTLRVQD